MKRILTYLAAVVSLSGIACGHESATPTSTDGIRTYAFDFNSGIQGWVGGVSYCPTVQQPVVDHRRLPTPLDESQSALFFSTPGGNDIGRFMYLKRQVTGLAPLAAYDATFTVTIAADERYGCGGGAVEVVYLKAGASSVEPVSSFSDGWFTMNIDIGAHQAVGTDAALLGNLVDSVGCHQPQVWQLKSLANGSPLRVRSGTDGSIWLWAGTMCTYYFEQSFYYARFTAVLQPVQ
jgi:hypothetical protein